MPKFICISVETGHVITESEQDYGCLSEDWDSKDREVGACHCV